MSPIVTSHRLLSPLAALVVGVLLAVIALVLAELIVGGQGHRIQFAQLPPEAQAIAMESHPKPISSQQWKRIDKIMETRGGWPSGGDLVLLSVQKAWFLFALLPAVALVFLRWRSVSTSVGSKAALVAPSVAAVAWASVSSLSNLLVV